MPHLPRFLFLIGCLLPLLVACSPARAEEPDPREIFKRHYEAVGGLERLKALQSGYSEGRIVYDGLTGTFKQWEAHPIFFRLDEEYPVFHQASGDDGNQAWVKDVNGKVLIQRDPDTIRRREVQIRLENFEHLDPGSDFFNLTYEGLQIVDDRPCHVVRTTNRLNKDICRSYFDAKNYHQLRQVLKQPDMEIETRFSDFREVEGLLHPFFEVTRIHPLEREIIISMERFIPNPRPAQAIFETPADDKPDMRFSKGDRCEDIPIQLIENNIYLPVKINCEIRLWLLDSGASMSVVDAAFAEEIGARSQGRIRGHGYGNNFDLGFVDLPAYQVGCIQMNSQKIFAYEGLAAGFHEPAAVGILGFDFLSRFVTRIDYDKNFISFFTPETFQYNGKGVRLEAPLKYKTFCLPAAVDGKYQGQWTIDLGAFSSSFNFPFAQSNNLMQREGVERISRGMAGEFRERTVRFRTFDLGGLTIDGPYINVPLASDTGAGVRAETIGNIGNSLLRHFILYLDYSRQQIILEKGAGFNQAPEMDKSGIFIGWMDTGYPRVILVAPGSPAQKAGIRPGDTLVAINGIDLAYFSGLVPVYRLLREKAGTRYTLRLEREERAIETKLELEDLYK